jgi:hypothetical protein
MTELRCIGENKSTMAAQVKVKITSPGYLLILLTTTNISLIK